GKSLIFQIPAIFQHQRGYGTTIVISPLIALMRDQVSQLQARGVKAGALNSSLDAVEEHQVKGEFLSGRLALLYVSPERAASPGFLRMIQKVRIAHLAIDEAHCISQWGHDFRPEYLQLGALKARLRVPTVALTATATPHIREEIEKALDFEDPYRVQGNFLRPNLSFSVGLLRKDAERFAALIKLLEEAGFREPGAGHAIIYGSTRKRVENVAVQLKQLGFKAGHYHGGRTEGAREKALKAYDLGRTPILSATNAFGMGIDTPDVRLIVHFDSPGSLAAYYQEAGRAGRDGDPATCALFFSERDLMTHERLAKRGTVSRSGLERASILRNDIRSYAHLDRCRQSFFQSYFNGAESDHRCETCDICTDHEAVTLSQEAFSTPTQAPAKPLGENEANIVLGAVGHLKRPVGKTLLARALRGSRAKDVSKRSLLALPEHGSLKIHSEAEIVATLDELLKTGQIVRKGIKYPTVWPANRPVRGSVQQTGIGPDEVDAQADDTSKPKKRSSRAKSRQSADPLVRALKSWRDKQARKLGWRRY
ncbi:ATP-dependent DNA helicase RecQ, partial [Myxococcota bacterium]|nr:ATP-dependent DNA helicase RecQ [Myxococcota bacterium]